MVSNVNRVALVGTGFVGTSFAYAMVNQGITGEIILIDVNKDKAEGEAMDIAHGIPFAPSRTKIRAGDYSDCRMCDVVVITAGANQKPGETRLELLERNAQIMKAIVKQIMSNYFNGILVIATNPVDILTNVAWKVSGLPKNRVIGSGTTLDTARLRHELSGYFDVDPRNVHAYIMGEHGDTEFAAWSHALIGVRQVEDIIEQSHGKYRKEDLEQIFVKVRDAAYHIIERKGATYYGIGMALTRIIKAILNDERSILSVSSFLGGEYGQNNIFIGVPAVVGRAGVTEVIELQLSDEEKQKLSHSVDVLKASTKPIFENL